MSGTDPVLSMRLGTGWTAARFVQLDASIPVMLSGGTVGAIRS